MFLPPKARANRRAFPEVRLNQQLDFETLNVGFQSPLLRVKPGSADNTLRVVACLPTRFTLNRSKSLWKRPVALRATSITEGDAQTSKTIPGESPKANGIEKLGVFHHRQGPHRNPAWGVPRAEL